jgi:uncharacterized protein (TIGR02452 family)
MKYRSNRAAKLAIVAKETIAALPDILHQIPEVRASKSELYVHNQTSPLNQADCPKFAVNHSQSLTNGTTIRVVDQDTLDAAIELSTSSTPSTKQESTLGAEGKSTLRVAVLNLASERTAGGGWLGGALAQEESICYRTSLYLSLHKSLYPLPSPSALYSPDVVIIRESWNQGHELLVPKVKPTDLHVVSVISVAAIRRPRVQRLQSTIDGKISEKEVFTSSSDRDLTKTKMRIALRVAASNGHRRLVLGALGCGAFKNPTEEVANCWLEVLREPEFTGGWWQDVIFAVLDKGSDGDNAARDRMGNFMTFYNVLDGKIV